MAAKVLWFSLRGNFARGSIVNANSIYDNGLSNNGMDIDLLPTGGMAGNTSNDSGDHDIGPNKLQNFPVPTGLAYTGQGSSNRPATLSGTLDSKPGNYRVDAYFSSAINTGGRGHAQVHLGRRTITQLLEAPPVSFTMDILVPDQLPNGVTQSPQLSNYRLSNSKSARIPP